MSNNVAIKVFSLFKKLGYARLAVLAAAVAILPNFLNPFGVHILIYTLWVIYIGVAWNILASGGQENLGHSLFIGAGAYTSTVLFLKLGISPWLGMLAGVVVALAIGLFLGLLCFPRALPLLAFALVTLAFAFVGLFVVSGTSFLGANEGLNIRFMETDPLKFQFMSKLPYFYIMLFMASGIVAVHWLVYRSRFGLCLRSIRDNPRAAEAMGVDLVRHKLRAMFLSAALTAPAGTFWAQYQAYIDPAGTLAPLVAITAIMFVLIGGIGMVWGPVIAAGILVPIGEVLRAKLGGQYPGAHMIIYGILIVLIILFMPQGIVGWLRGRLRRGQRPGRLPASE